MAEENAAIGTTVVEKSDAHWSLDTRTVIVCWMMASSFALIVLLIVKGVPTGEGGTVLSTLLGMYVGSAFITSVQWWMGSAKGSDANNKMQERMADAIRPASIPEAKPAVVSWWTRLNNAETISIMADTDEQVKAFVVAAKDSKATPAQIAYLVTKGHLKPERAAEIQAA